MLINTKHLAELNSTKQKIKARVEIYKGSTLEKICTCGDVLSDFTIERLGEGKFFGFGISHQLKVNLIDINREIEITKEHSIEVAFGVENDFLYTFPVFHVKEVTRDETSNMISIVANDSLYGAADYTVNDLGLLPPYTIRQFIAACAALFDKPFKIINIEDSLLDYSFVEGANFEGTETVRSALNAIAEATQSIYYLDSNWNLTFKRLNKTSSPVITVNKNQYFTLTNTGEQVLGAVVHVTELGDNVEPTNMVEGVRQYVRDNPFWNMREDIATVVNDAQAAVGGLAITQFNSDWSGNYLLEIGDRVAFVKEDGTTFNSYVLDDSIAYTGALSQYTKWEYAQNDTESAANPASVGDVLNQTKARVDKVNREIELIASEVNNNTSAIASLQINTSSISASVRSMEENIESSHEEINQNYEKLTKEVNAKVTAEDVQIAISSELSNGVDAVKTTTGFTFDKDGLKVSKTDSEISTTITEDGMAIDKNGTEVLRADNQGVIAKDLHAVTYLWIGDNSRFEDQGNRTACFWVAD